MKYEIETYKGQLIEYDEDYDKFICDISIEDKYKSTKRSSLKDVKKEIDTFIKLNLDFKPFKVIYPSSWGNDFEIKLISAIRTDGKFVIEPIDKSYRSKSYLNKKEMSELRQYDADLVKEKSIIDADLKKAEKIHSENLKSISSKLIPIDLSKYEYIMNPEKIEEERFMNFLDNLDPDSIPTPNE